MPRTSRFSQQRQEVMQILFLVLIGVLLYKLCSYAKSTFPDGQWNEQMARNRRMIALARFLHIRYRGDTSQMRPADARIYERYVNYIDPRSPLESNQAFPDMYSSDEEEM